MPRQDTPVPISGKLGNHIYYYRKDRKNRKHHFMRQAPLTVTQTSATKRTAVDFGTASKSSRLIRRALHEYTGLCYDNSLHHRLNTKIGEILRADVNHPAGQRVLTTANLLALKHFQFNEAANIHQLLKESPVIENEMGDINISLPATFSKSRHALRNTTHIAIRAIGLSVNFARGTAQEVESNRVLIKRGGAPTPVTLTMNMNRRNLTLIILEVQSFYEVNGQLQVSKNKQGHALDIIAVLPPVEKPVEQKRKYRNKAPRFWLPYITPARGALLMMPVDCNSLPEG